MFSREECMQEGSITEIQKRECFHTGSESSGDGRAVGREISTSSSNKQHAQQQQGSSMHGQTRRSGCSVYSKHRIVAPAVAPRSWPDLLPKTESKIMTCVVFAKFCVAAC